MPSLPFRLEAPLYIATQHCSALWNPIFTNFMTWPLSLLSISYGSTEEEKVVEEAGLPKAEVKSRPMSPPLPVKELLRHFEAPGVPPPPSARVGDPTLKQREYQPFRLVNLWKYGMFAATKGVCPVSWRVGPSQSVGRRIIRLITLCYSE